MARLRGGVKRATVKADEEDDDTEEDEEDSSSGPMSALTGVFKNVRGSCFGLGSQVNITAKGGTGTPKGRSFESRPVTYPSLAKKPGEQKQLLLDEALLLVAMDSPPVGRGILSWLRADSLRTTSLIGLTDRNATDCLRCACD